MTDQKLSDAYDILTLLEARSRGHLRPRGLGVSGYKHFSVSEYLGFEASEALQFQVSGCWGFRGWDLGDRL